MNSLSSPAITIQCLLVTIFTGLAIYSPWIGVEKGTEKAAPVKARKTRSVSVVTAIASERTVTQSPEQLQIISNTPEKDTCPSAHISPGANVATANGSIQAGNQTTREKAHAKEPGLTESNSTDKYQSLEEANHSQTVFTDAPRWPISIILGQNPSILKSEIPETNLLNQEMVENTANNFLKAVQELPSHLTAAQRIAAWNKAQRAADQQLRTLYGHGAWTAMHSATANMPWPGYVEE